VYPHAVSLLAHSDVDALSIEYEQPHHDADFLTAVGDKDVILGVLDLNPSTPPETVEHICRRVREATKVVAPERLSLAPDCGMWFLPRPVATQKLRSMCLAAEVLRHELRG